MFRGIFWKNFKQALENFGWHCQRSHRYVGRFFTETAKYGSTVCFIIITILTTSRLVEKQKVPKNIAPKI